MKPLVPASLFLLVASAALAGPPAGAPRTRRPKVDEAAMREAMAAARAEETFSSSSSYAHYLKARLAHHAGDHRAAVDELRLALATDDGNPLLLTALAEEYARLSELDRAERELLRAIERRPGYHPAHLMLGRVLLEGRKTPRAQAHLRRAIRLRPKDPAAYLVLAQLELERDRPAAAVAVVEGLAKALPGDATGYRRLGLALAERHDHARAEAMLKKAVDRDPGDFEAWVALGELYLATARLGPAEDAYARALERDPDDRDVLMAAGKLALRQGSVVRARAYYDRVLSLTGDPQVVATVAFAYLAAHQAAAAADALERAQDARAEEPRLAFYLGLVEQRLRRFDRAAVAFADVPAGHELFDEARLHRATSLSRAGRHAEALGLFEAAVAARPTDLSSYAPYAQALERSGANAEAERLLRGALERFRRPATLEALAAHLQRTGRNQEAVELLRDGTREFPGDENLLFALGAAHDRRGEVEACLAQMRAVLAVNPQSAAAMNYIGYTLADRGRDLEEAEALLLKANALRPDTGEYVDSLGWLYLRRGDHAKAVSLLERAVELLPSDATVRDHLGDAYLRASRVTDAADQYRHALQALDAGEEDPQQARELRKTVERKLKLLSTQAADR